MRRWSVLVIACSLLPLSALAQSIPISTIRLAHPFVLPGQSQTITVTARDLNGRPLAGARALARVGYGSHYQTLRMRDTNRAGISVLILRPPKALTHSRVTVSVSITNGYISIPLSARFDIRPAGSRTPTPKPTGVSTKPPAQPSSTGTPPATPTGAAGHATPTATTPTVGQPAPIVLVAQPVPPAVVAPAPGWIVAYVRTTAGVDLEGAMVRITAPFSEGTVAAAGLTDANGAVSVLVDTSAVHNLETVMVQVSAVWGTQIASATEPLTVSPPPTPLPATPVPGAMPIPSATPVPTSSTVPVVPSGSVGTVLPTDTAVPTVTPMPTPTLTPVPTPTVAPTSTPIPGCPGTMSSCMQAMLGIINDTRAQNGLSPLALSPTQSAGTGTCVGSIGHSTAMQQSGYIWHTNPNYPAASFPNNICGYMSAAGQNVGMSNSGNELQDLHIIHNMMMNETHSSTYCMQYVNHACNILSTKFTQIGIGIYYVPSGAGAGTWLTEDFIG